MKKQKRVGLLNKKISNRLSYTIIAFVSLMLVGIFVFAAAPNPGHDYNDLDLGPVSIYGNEEAGSLEVTAGPVRAAAFCLVDDTCITTWPTGGSSFWSVGGYGGIYYNDRVGIAGNTGPNGLELDVNGQIGADSYCDSQGYSCKTITELSSGGGSTPTLAQVLAQGYDAEGRNIYNVGTLSIKDGGSINTYYGQIEIKDKNINMKSGGNILNAGTITANTVQANTLEDPEDDILTINDALRVEKAGENIAMYIYGDGSNTGLWSRAEDYGVRGYGSIGIYGYGATGIKGWATGTAVHGEGNTYDFYAAGPGTNYGSSSSIRWKENVIEIDNALDKVLNIRGVYFDWDEEHGGQNDMGFIAEEIGEYIPEIVSFEDATNQSNHYTENGEDKIYASGVDYGALTPVLVEAIKEQQEMIKQQNNTINQLKLQMQEICLKDKTYSWC